MNITIEIGITQSDFLKKRKTVVLSYFVHGEKKTKYTRIYDRDRKWREKLKKWVKKKKTQIKKELTQ